jgi:SOS-response transcriptional repressor LexA
MRSTNGFVYDYLYKTIQQLGYPPTLQEIATECGLDESFLMQCLDQLEREGRIIRVRNKPSSIRIPQLDWQWYREDQITRFIHTYTQDYQTAPTVFDIAKGCGLSTTVVMECLAHQSADAQLVNVNPLSLLATA